MSCKYYVFKSNDYYCLKKEDYVSSDTYWSYCRNYDYADCPIYKTETSGGCYLTSACVEVRGLADDCYELETLRNYRDTFLKETEEGRCLICRYYKIAPQIVSEINKRVDRKKIFDEIYEHMVTPCLRYIEDGENEKALELYRMVTLKLEDKYIKNTEEVNENE